MLHADIGAAVSLVLNVVLASAVVAYAYRDYRDRGVVLDEDDPTAIILSLALLGGLFVAATAIFLAT